MLEFNRKHSCFKKDYISSKSNWTYKAILSQWSKYHETIQELIEMESSLIILKPKGKGMFLCLKTCHISKILLESKLKKVLLLTAIVMIEAECIHQELANLLINLMGIQSFCRFLTRKILEGNFLISQGVLQVCSR